jgi:hypothetical protein
MLFSNFKDQPMRFDLFVLFLSIFENTRKLFFTFIQKKEENIRFSYGMIWKLNMRTLITMFNGSDCIFGMWNMGPQHESKRFCSDFVYITV